MRGILNDNHGGPLTPPGLLLSKALEEVSNSLERNLKHGKTPISSKLKRLNGFIKRGLSVYQQDITEIVEHVEKIEEIFKTLEPQSGTKSSRLRRFKKIKKELAVFDDSVKVHMNKIMNSFEPGLFVVR